MITRLRLTRSPINGKPTLSGWVFNVYLCVGADLLSGPGYGVRIGSRTLIGVDVWESERYRTRTRHYTLGVIGTRRKFHWTRTI